MSINAHTHMYSGLVPLGMPAPSQEPSNFVEILEQVWWKLDRALDAESIKASAEYYVSESLRLGCTGLIDHHESPEYIEGSLDLLANACQDLGLPAVLCYGATERNGGREEAKRGLAECRRLITTNQSPLIKGAIGLHACFTVSDETIREAAQMAHELDTVLHIHLAEDKADVRDAQKRGYRNLIHRLQECDAMLSGSIFAHGVHLTKEEVQACAEAGIWLVQNPRSNQGNKVGYPAALSESTLVALGTDGYEADMQCENKILIEHASEAQEDMGMVHMRADASAVLLGTFWDGTEPQAGPALSAERVKTIQEQANQEATRLWQRMRSL